MSALKTHEKHFESWWMKSLFVVHCVWMKKFFNRTSSSSVRTEEKRQKLKFTQTSCTEILEQISFTWFFSSAYRLNENCWHVSKFRIIQSIQNRIWVGEGSLNSQQNHHYVPRSFIFPEMKSSYDAYILLNWIWNHNTCSRKKWK